MEPLTRFERGRRDLKDPLERRGGAAELHVFIQPLSRVAALALCIVAGMIARNMGNDMVELSVIGIGIGR